MFYNTLYANLYETCLNWTLVPEMMQNYAIL
uniref:Uncharacterized protein n=1 Tax=Rhizophora mucronata TaxID=61149 RepID=A0A2P2N692_RHIMU